MRERLLTPSKITAWLDCAHFLTLRTAVDDGRIRVERHQFGEMADMLLKKGLTHEQEVLARYRAAGREVVEVAPRGDAESFAAWVGRVESVLADGPDVIYQMPFVHDGIRGVADFLERVTAEDGAVTYEPVDAKLARAAAKPGHVLQLCFYAEAIAARTGGLPERIHVELGSGERETIRTADVLPYWRRLRRSLADLLAQPPEDSEPEPNDHCGFCEFEPLCDEAWRAADALVYVAGLRSADRRLLEAAGVATLADLAALDQPVEDIDPQRLERLVRQAALQARAREAADDAPPPYELLPADLREPDPAAPVGAAGVAGEDGTDEQPLGPTLVGFAALPAPDEGDIFLDFEGHPFWRADIGLFFLFGLIEQDRGEWRYRAWWAHDRAEEGQATAHLVAYLEKRRRRYPGMHVYHYNHTERTALTSLARDHAVAELALETLVGTGAFVDLYPVVTGALQAGVESYGLKHIERLTDFQRSHDIDRGAGAVIEYEYWTVDGDQARLQRIARYNEDDVRATRAVRDWLVEHRPEGIPWRPALLDPDKADPELDQRIEALHAYGQGTDEHLMGDLLGYWRRERRVVAADCLRLSLASLDEQLASPSVIAGLEFQGIEERFSTKTGRPLKWPAAVFSFPPQPIDPGIAPRDKLILPLQEHKWLFFPVDSIDREAGLLTVEWDDEAEEAGPRPASLVHWAYYAEGAKRDALCALADQMLDGQANGVGHAILRHDPPAFLPGQGPRDALLVGGCPEACGWVPGLRASYLPVQGPPGTGKTYTGSHVISTLVRQGKRVGVTAMSHHAIDNLLKAVVARFADDPAALRAVHKHGSGAVAGIDYIDDNKRCATGPFDVIGGTPWLFASPAMRDNPVDVLVVDEAGQLGLADTLAATISATDVVLLGDPQQLPQVAQASHPNRSGVSALEHLLGEGVRTFPPDRGMLLDVSWRMHPEVCRFISEVMYDGRLTSEPSCARQSTAFGTGLRWIRAEHDARSTQAPEEAAIVVELIGDLLDTTWTDQDGRERQITAADVIVVTPYNDQRRLITDTLAADPTAASVEVGTVDKFQGREAAVVIFSMATSSADFLPRDADFLFSKNRLNVAVSRARCLAYLVCTEDLLDTRARDVEQMTLISALCAFVEQAETVATVVA